MIILLFLGGCSDTENSNESSNNTPQTDTTPVVISPIIVKPNPYKNAGWYAKTVVVAIATDGTVYRHATAGVFGELVQSSDDKDKHDIVGYGAAVFQIIFIPNFSTDTTAGYFSEYKHYDEATPLKKSWTFLVKNQKDVNLSYAAILIGLSTINDVKYRDDNGHVKYKESRSSDEDFKNNLHLVDIDNTKEYTIDELETANLSMQGLHTRTFKWVLGSVESSDYVTAIPSPKRAASRVNTISFKSASTQPSSDTFGLPPQ